MCRAMKRSSTDVMHRPWFRSGKTHHRAVRSTRRCPHPCVPPRPLPLRPVNVRGHSAKGMRAPENTNQFLMTEKYALHALRSDSVDSESADSDPELSADLEEYLCAWEDAHGALLEQDIGEREGRETHSLVRSLDTKGREGDRDCVYSGLSGHSSGQSLLSPDEDSSPYFPSEADLQLSDNFMDRDFTEFCHTVTS